MHAEQAVPHGGMELGQPTNMTSDGAYFLREFENAEQKLRSCWVVRMEVDE
jgi:hypothetical protein